MNPEAMLTLAGTSADKSAAEFGLMEASGLPMSS